MKASNKAGTSRQRQAVTNEHQIILAAEVTNQPTT